MPIHTYDTPEQALATARQFVDAGAQAVKLEGGVSHVPQIEAITRAGIPFMAHIGMLPQSVREEGGYKVKGRTQTEAEALIADARAVEKAGAFSVVLEIVCPGNCETNYQRDRHSDHRDRLGRALRRTNSGYARFDRLVSVVYSEICFTGSARGGRDSSRGNFVYRTNPERQRIV